MSVATLKVRFEDGLILHGLYDGTNEIPLKGLVHDDPWKHRHTKFLISRTCTCGGHDEEVEIGTDYANGSEWKGRACKQCMVLTDTGEQPYGEYPNLRDESDELPDWWEETSI